MAERDPEDGARAQEVMARHRLPVEYRVWQAGELVPPTVEQLEWIQDRERERRARRRLREWQRRERLIASPRSSARLVRVLGAWPSSRAARS
jgi:hypothetical protein